MRLYLEADPIGILGGRNHLYAYVGDNPINGDDPFGLAKMYCRLLSGGLGFVSRQRHCYLVADDGTKYGLYPEWIREEKIGVPRTNDPRDTGGEMYDCPCPERNPCDEDTLDQNSCLKKAHDTYPIGVYKKFGPNSNTYAGTLARKCCKGGVPAGVHDVPGINDPPPQPIY